MPSVSNRGKVPGLMESLTEWFVGKNLTFLYIFQKFLSLWLQVFKSQGWIKMPMFNLDQGKNCFGVFQEMVKNKFKNKILSSLALHKINK